MTEHPRPTYSIHSRGFVPPYVLEHMEATQTPPPNPTEELVNRKKEELRKIYLQQITGGLGRLAEQKARIDDVTHWKEADDDTKHTIEKSEGETNE